jgi:translocation and assembly module TamB
MQVPTISVRIIKFLGRAILGFLLILLLVVALIHLPAVQKQITRKLSAYLSSKIEAKVEIQKTTFSVLGNIAINDITVWDPDNNKIFYAQKIEVATSIYNLVTGDYIFDQVHISGATIQLTQKQEGLNIQFILDAFESKEKKSTQVSPIKLQFKQVVLENIRFDFASTISGLSVTTNIGTFATQEVEISTNPTTIKADQVSLQKSVVNMISRQTNNRATTTESAKNNKPLNPDFNTGIIFEIKRFTLKDNDFSFHREVALDTRKFDLAHLTLNNIQVNLSEIAMNEDILVAKLNDLAVQLPGFMINKAEANLIMNQNHLKLTKLELAAGTSELQATIAILVDSTNAANDQMEIDIQGQVNPNDFAYFFQDSIVNLFSPWGTTQLAIEGNYSLNKGKIKTLHLKTGNSKLDAHGMVNDIFNLTSIAWKDLVVKATIGSDFQRIVSPLLPSINLPLNLQLQLTSSGNPNNLVADVKANSLWGEVDVEGQVTRQVNNVAFNLNLRGEKVDLGKWMSLPWLGPMDLKAGATGIIGKDQQFEISGLIDNITILDQSIHNISFEGNTKTDTATVTITIADSHYSSKINSEISFPGPWEFKNTIQFDNFNLGRILSTDSTLLISGNTKSKITLGSSSLEGSLAGTRMLFQKKSAEFSMDTLAFHALLSPTKSNIDYFTDNAKANLVANFDIRDLPKVFEQWSGSILKDPDQIISSTENRTAQVNIDLENANFIKLFGIEVDNFSSMKLTGEFDEQKQTAMVNASSGKIKGYGITLDTLNTTLMALRDSLAVNLNVQNLLYDAIHLGNLNFDILTKGDTAISTLTLANDTLTLLGLHTRTLTTDSGAYVYPDKLRTFNHDYIIDKQNPIFFTKNNLAFNHFTATYDDMEIKLDGDLNDFDVSLKNIDVTRLNLLLSSDTIRINKGHLTANISYSRNQQLDLKANLDSLILYNSSPMMIEATAMSDGNEVPFEFLLTNTTNKIELKGNYFSDKEEVDASLLLDVNNLELLQFLVSGVIEKMNGAIQGEATISGPIIKPDVKGDVRFVDVDVTTTTPKLTFNIEDDHIKLDNSALLFKNFTIYDTKHNPLTIDGSITSKDYQSFAYDLQIKSDHYTLINNPDSTSGKLRGLLVIDSDIKLKGNEKDKYVEAKLTIKDDTNLTYANSSDDIELLEAGGIIDFIDPDLLDSAVLESSVNFYDSLIASLPDFNLTSTVSIEDNATFKLLIDERSGDYIEASGAADLELGYDRTGNLTLTGNYTINKGVYRLSFYDLVKKSFTLTQGSSINWHGNPKNGDLNIKALHTVKSNSLGLIGQEIGENEKSIYKRSLDYEVGINITGTIEEPIISFSLDLPQNEKASYPVLANKLDRLRQPEFESELNKQVFGLLVLGGFLPESSASDINSSLIATTALSNSVNSLLASQLNRFANQYIKGVEIDVGIQSFSDYSAPGGRTQTAMDFRVSKKLMNDRLSFEIGGDFDINEDQSGANTGKNYRGDIAIIYDLTGKGDKQLKLFNNETHDIIYQEIRNTGVSLIFIREFEKKEKRTSKNKIK